MGSAQIDRFELAYPDPSTENQTRRPVKLLDGLIDTVDPTAQVFISAQIQLLTPLKNAVCETLAVVKITIRISNIGDSCIIWFQVSVGSNAPNWPC